MPDQERYGTRAVMNDDGGVAISSALAAVVPNAITAATQRTLLFTTPRRYNDEPMYRIRETRRPDSRSPKSAYHGRQQGKAVRPQNPQFCDNFATPIQVVDLASRSGAAKVSRAA